MAGARYVIRRKKPLEVTSHSSLFPSEKMLSHRLIITRFKIFLYPLLSWRNGTLPTTAYCE